MTHEGHMDTSEDIGTVRWFGTTWKAPICDPRAHVETPVGLRCARCEERIASGDRGLTVPVHPPGPRLAWHLKCWLREIGADLHMPVD